MGVQTVFHDLQTSSSAYQIWKLSDNIEVPGVEPALLRLNWDAYSATVLRDGVLYAVETPIHAVGDGLRYNKSGTWITVRECQETKICLIS
jgi:hypothetical protein